MKKDRQKVEDLRKKGLSYKTISHRSGIQVSTIAGWLRGLPWSDDIRDKLSRESYSSSPQKVALLSRANRERWEKWRAGFRNNAEREFSSFKNEPLFASGLLLYWGEGDKMMKNSRVKLSSSEPEMIKIFYKFLKYIGVQDKKIHLWLLLYPDLIETVQKNFWSKAVDLPVENFSKSIFIKGRHPKRRLSYGVCNVEVYSREFKEKIMRWLELYKAELLTRWG